MMEYQTILIARIAVENPLVVHMHNIAQNGMEYEICDLLWRRNNKLNFNSNDENVWFVMCHMCVRTS